MTTIDMIGMTGTLDTNRYAIVELATKGLISFNVAKELLRNLNRIHEEYLRVGKGEVITHELPEKLSYEQVKELLNL